ncbi:zf-CCHC domain-containing protein [Tanacetum coccineum]
MISKNDEAKIVIYNALPKKEYVRIFMCKTAKDVWNSLIITHQDNKQVKDNKIDLFVQKYEEFVISDDETIDCAFARFNTIITSLKALDESFSSRNHVRKFLRALPTKWCPKVTAIEESKDLLTLPLDELIGNLKVYEVVLEKDSDASNVKKEKYKSLALKERKVSSDEEESYSGSDEEYAMAVRDFKKFFRRRGKFVRQPHDDKKSFQKVKEEKKGKEDQRCFNCGDPNHFISNCPKHSFNDQTAFVRGCWSESDKEDESKKDEICIMALDNNEVLSDTPYYSSSSLDSESLQNEYNKLCKISLRIINKNKHLKAKNELLNNESCALKKKLEGIASTSKRKTEKLSPVDEQTSTVELAVPVPSASEPASSNVGNRPSTEDSKFLEFNIDYLTKFDPKSTKGVFLGYSPNSKAYIILNKETMRIKESLNVRFEESPPPKSSPLVDDDIIETQIIENQIEDIEIKENEPLNKEIVNIKESKGHHIDSVICKDHRRIIPNSVENGLLIWHTVEQENGETVRPKEFHESLPPDVYALVNHHKITKDIWDRVKLLMQGTSLSRKELNTMFLNSLPPKWGKFVTDVKLARDLHTSNYDQLYAYLEQHEAHANEAA